MGITATEAPANPTETSANTPDRVASPDELTHAAGEQAPCTTNAANPSANGRLMVGDPIPAVLTPNELREALGYSRSHFWRLERAGALDHLLANLVPGVREYSGLKLAAMLGSRAVDQREQRKRRKFFATARRRHAVHDRAEVGEEHRKTSDESFREATKE
jgi:hypothetical protein